MTYILYVNIHVNTPDNDAISVMCDIEILFLDNGYISFRHSFFDDVFFEKFFRCCISLRLL